MIEPLRITGNVTVSKRKNTRESLFLFGRGSLSVLRVIKKELQWRV